MIVEDKLNKGISLVEQFKEFSKEHSEYQINVSDICYFCSNVQRAEEEIEKKAECGFNVRHVTLRNFNKIIDDYLYCTESWAFLIMDFIQEGDGSGGVPMQRVNIRYARSKNWLATNQLWFYTRGIAAIRLNKNMGWEFEKVRFLSYKLFEFFTST